MTIHAVDLHTAFGRNGRIGGIGRIAQSGVAIMRKLYRLLDRRTEFIFRSERRKRIGCMTARIKKQTGEQRK